MVYDARIGIVVLVTLSIAMAGCEDEEPKLEVGDYCSSHDACDSGLCARVPAGSNYSLYCSTSCAEAETCPDGMVCANLHTSGMVCVNTCSSDFEYYNESHDPDYACVGGVPTMCSDITTDEYCEHCGCDVAGEYCNRFTEPPSCDLPGEIGADCLVHEACISNNCSVNYRYSAGTEVGQCFVELGAPCTDDNCDFCWADGGFCSRECSDDDSCPGSMVCVGHSDPDFYWCRDNCADSTCCYSWDDCGHCSAAPSLCRSGFECERYTYNYETVGYSCTWP